MAEREGSRPGELLDLLRDGWGAIWAHRLRSLLTLTGIVFGVSALVAMFSIVAGIKTMVFADFEEFGTKLTVEFEHRPPESRKAADRASAGLLASERDSLVALDLVTRGAAGMFTELVGRARLEPRRYPVTAIGPDYLAMRHMSIVRGRGLADLDNDRRAAVAVLGTRAARELFGDVDPIGREFLLNGQRIRAVGIVEAPRLRLIPADFDWLERRIYLPVGTYLARFTDDRTVDFIAVNAPSYEQVGPALRDAEARLLRLHRGVRDFEIDNLAAEYGEDVALASSITTGWNLVLGAIAIISLVIGGIGLFSVLQVSVRERVREIGIRKSVGAENRDIRREFLAESLILAALGGLLGILFGTALCTGAEAIAGTFGRQWEIPISYPGAALGFVFAMVVGFVFGLYPARRAAELDPVTAISG